MEAFIFQKIHYRIPRLIVFQNHSRTLFIHEPSGLGKIPVASVIATKDLELIIIAFNSILL